MNTTGTLEILAPAGSYDSLVAAVRCGANAVYLGSKAQMCIRDRFQGGDHLGDVVAGEKTGHLHRGGPKDQGGVADAVAAKADGLVDVGDAKPIHPCTGHGLSLIHILDVATCIGSGRLAELALFCENTQADMVIFDHELTPAQLRNIEDACDTSVLDRTMLILDIFAQRARSGEGKLQVELAQQRYLLPRLAGLGNILSRQGGGIGTRGPGETKLETDRRHIRARIHALEERLESLTRHRENLRARRKKEDVYKRQPCPKGFTQ